MGMSPTVAEADVPQSAGEVALDAAMLREDSATLRDEAHLLRETVRANVQVTRLLRAELRTKRSKLNSLLNHQGHS